jgi:hypothetical protein
MDEYDEQIIDKYSIELSKLGNKFYIYGKDGIYQKIKINKPETCIVSKRIHPRKKKNNGNILVIIAIILLLLLVIIGIIYRKKIM